jgi:hypothetical protein
MNPRLRSMIIAVGVVALGGVGFGLFTPQPATRSMLELRDAGILDGQRFVFTCPERLTPLTKRRINANQPGQLRPKQSYARIARVAVCFNLDGGNCWRPSDWAPRVDAGEADIVVPSLRRDTTGLDADAGEDVDGGEDAVDDSFQFRSDDCTSTRCSDFDAGDGTNFCGRLNRLMLVAPPCMMPNGWGRAADGGWCEESCGGPVDCLCSGPFGLPDGGPRWRGFNTCPVQYSSGAACVPTECSVVAGDIPSEWL